MTYGLIGKNLSHSYSQYIHESLFIKPYRLYEINNLEDVFSLKLDGFNITNPYKHSILPYLDQYDDIVKQTQTVNTVKRINNKLYGFNTDYDGFASMIEHYKVDFTDKDVIIIGNGASSRTVEYYLKSKPIKSLKKLVRTIRTDKDDLLKNQKKYPNTQIIINTTPYGMSPNMDHKSLIDFKNFPECTLVIDLIYNPFRTQLLIEAEKFNIQTINGLYMLLMQAKKAEEIFLNKEIPMMLIKEIHHQIIHTHVNIVLIGLPMSGKSTYGKLLGINLDKEWIDTDERIEQYSKLTISQIFKLSGEEKFRQIEKSMIHSLIYKQGKIISCGGGVVKDLENISYLKANGLIIYIDKAIEIISSLDFKHRPLLKTQDDLLTLHKERKELYLKSSDIHFIIDKEHPFNLEKLKAVIYEYFDH